MKSALGVRNLRLRILFLAAAMLLGTAVSAGAQQDLSGLYAQAGHSVAAVVAYDWRGLSTAFGTGFFAHDEPGDGPLFFTNHHVLEYAHSASIMLLNGDWYDVSRVLRVDEKYDLMVVEIDIPAHKMPPGLPLAQRLPEVGQPVLTIGTPQGLTHSLATGVVSALRNREWYGFPADIQISVPISPGNSGGPLLNMQGEVLGIVTFGIRDGEQLNFARTYIRGNRPLSGVLPQPLTLAEWQADSGYPYARSLVDDGWKLQQDGNIELALEWYEVALDENPRYAYGWFRKGYALSQIGDRQEAIDAYDVTIRLDSTYAAAYNNRAVQYESLGRLPAAFNGFRSAVEHDPGDPLYHRNLGRLYAKLGRRDLAWRAYDILLGLESGDEEAAKLYNFLMAN